MINKTANDFCSFLLYVCDIIVQNKELYTIYICMYMRRPFFSSFLQIILISPIMRRRSSIARKMHRIKKDIINRTFLSYISTDAIAHHFSFRLKLKLFCIFSCSYFSTCIIKLLLIYKIYYNIDYR